MTCCAECRYLSCSSGQRDVNDSRNVYSCHYHQVEGRMVHPADEVCNCACLIKDVIVA